MTNNENWQKNNNFLEKHFHVETFVQAIDFINKIAKIAEQSGHHPDILLHDYNQVKVQITTHDEAKITKKDYDLAVQIDLL